MKKLGLLARPRLLAVLLVLESVIAWSVAIAVRSVLGSTLDASPRWGELLTLEPMRWAELLFVQKVALPALVWPLLLALVAWAALGALLPAVFVSAFVRGDRGMVVVESAVHAAPGLWRIGALGAGLQLLFALPGLLVAWAVAVGGGDAPSYDGYVRATVAGAMLSLPALAIGGAVIDAARLRFLDGDERPFATALRWLRQRPRHALTLGLGYGAGWLWMVGLYGWVLPLAMRTMVGVLIWRLLFVTTRLVIASGRLLGVHYAMRTDSKWVSSQKAR